MSFTPLLSPESTSYSFIPSSLSGHLSSLVALCNSILAATFALVDNLASRIPPSWCPRCRFRILRESYLRTEIKATAPASDRGPESYILKKLEDTDGESTRTALVFYPSTEVYTLKKLQDIDVEKAIFRDNLPTSAMAVKVQLPGKAKLLQEVLGDETPKTRRLKHQPSLIDGIFILPASAGTRTTTTSINEGHGDRLRAELPTVHGSVKQKKRPRQHDPAELPADGISPVSPQAVLPAAPRLLVPRPRSPNTRKASPLLAPPPFLSMASPETRTSRASSMGSQSIQIAYTPSH